MRRKLKYFTLSAVVGLFACNEAISETLNDTMRLALINSPSIEAAQLDISLAEEALRSAQAQRAFQISAGVTSQLQSVGTDRAFGVDIGETWVNQASIEATIPLFTSGRLTASITQAELSVAVAEQALQARRQDLLAEAIVAHLELAFAREAVTIRDRNLNRLSRQFEAAGDRFEAGVITRTDVALSEARLRGAEAELAAANAAVAGAEAQYLRLTGEAPGGLADPRDELTLAIDFDSALTALNSSNPTLLRFELLEQVAAQGIQIAESQRGVQVEAFGSIAVQTGSWENDFNDQNAVVGARARLPLYTGGRVNSAIRSAGMSRQQIRFQREDARLALTAVLTDLWARRLAAESAVVAAGQAVEANQTALEGAEIEVSVGLRTTLDLLDQEQQLLESELRLAEARKDLAVASCRILALLARLSA